MDNVQINNFCARRVNAFTRLRQLAAACLLVYLSTSLLFSTSTLSAQTKAEADSAYVQGRYEEAVALNSALLKKGENAVIFYNLGNAYYRLHNVPRAILNYERALLRDPGNGDYRFNLALARSKTIDKVPEESEMFFVSWTYALINMMSADGWGRAALTAFGLGLLLLCLYLFSGRVLLRKIGFFGAFAMLFVVIVGNVFAGVQKGQLNAGDKAIVMEVTTVRSTPTAGGTELFVLHGGTKVEITDNTMRDWKEIRLADGKEGWIDARQIEVI